MLLLSFAWLKHGQGNPTTELTMTEVKVKVVLLGRFACGKTSLWKRFLDERFAGENRYQGTIGAAYGARRVEVAGRELVLGVWHTAGSERFESITRSFYRGARAAVVCYDVTDAASWERLQFWAEEVQREEEKCRIYIAATKTDLIAGDNTQRAVDLNTTTVYCDSIGAQLFETSSKDGTNIQKLFHVIASDCLRDEEISNFHQNSIQLQQKRESKSCCG